jgi:hypothetical protein
VRSLKCDHEQILKARGENPDMGAKRLVSFLKDQGTSVSLNAVKKIIQVRHARPNAIPRLAAIAIDHPPPEYHGSTKIIDVDAILRSADVGSCVRKQDSDGAGSEGGGRSGVGTQRAFLSAGKVERRDAKIPGCGQGLFATAAVKAGERLFSVRPALSVVFDPAVNRVCGLYDSPPCWMHSRFRSVCRCLI